MFVQVAALEVEAQATSCRFRMQTFAANADIHNRQIPQGVAEKEYRPGGVPPEMPTMLAGARSERVKQAEALHARSTAMLQATRNVIRLEAEDAFVRWRQAERQGAKAKAAAEAGDKLANDLSNDLRSGLKVRVEDVINGESWPPRLAGNSTNTASSKSSPCSTWSGSRQAASVPDCRNRRPPKRRRRKTNRAPGKEKKNSPFDDIDNPRIQPVWHYSLLWPQR